MQPGMKVKLLRMLLYHHKLLFAAFAAVFCHQSTVLATMGEKILLSLSLLFYFVLLFAPPLPHAVAVAAGSQWT